jgi:hypothetical protein
MSENMSKIRKIKVDADGRKSSLPKLPAITKIKIKKLKDNLDLTEDIETSRSTKK